MNNPHKLGLWSSTAFVVGNMIGSGVFLLPSTLASYGWLAYLAWTASAVGAIFLALVFGKLAKLDPDENGGPYAYTLKGLGDFPGFLVAWGYWISIWCTNAAIAVALVGYLEVFIPSLATNKAAAIATGLSVIWILTYLNTKSLKKIAFFQLLTSILKLAPVLFLGLIGVLYVSGNPFRWYPIQEEGSLFELLTAATTLTFFAFLGMESATISSKDTLDASKTVSKATIIGTLLTGFVYLLSYIVISQTLSPDILKSSNAPFADTAFTLWGENARYIIAAGAVIATLGALNGWLLIQGKIPLTAANQGLFPKVFAKTNQYHSPTTGIVLSSILVSILMLLNYSKTLVEAFSFMMKLSTLSVITPYIFSTSVLALWAVQKNLKNKSYILLLSSLAFLFSIWMVIGSGFEIVFWGFLLLMFGLPIYVYLKSKS